MAKMVDFGYDGTYSETVLDAVRRLMFLYPVDPECSEGQFFTMAQVIQDVVNSELAEEQSPPPDIARFLSKRYRQHAEKIGDVVWKYGWESKQVVDELKKAGIVAKSSHWKDARRRILEGAIHLR